MEHSSARLALRENSVHRQPCLGVLHVTRAHLLGIIVVHSAMSAVLGTTAPPKGARGATSARKVALVEVNDLLHVRFVQSAKWLLLPPVPHVRSVQQDRSETTQGAFLSARTVLSVHIVIVQASRAIASLVALADMQNPLARQPA